MHVRLPAHYGSRRNRRVQKLEGQKTRDFASVCTDCPSTLKYDVMGVVYCVPRSRTTSHSPRSFPISVPVVSDERIKNVSAEVHHYEHLLPDHRHPVHHRADIAGKLKACKQGKNKMVCQRQTS